ncbi:galactosylceramide sulfotransferase-like isoform X1 [Branchiostoma lanceolatum]|uniref:galactosylceramide sulfotransferase-like isoform X1 n=1 Tax=Branchiostoma lanceolatum TaxID=7740 RepID=UPI00345508DA
MFAASCARALRCRGKLRQTSAMCVLAAVSWAAFYVFLTRKIFVEDKDVSRAVSAGLPVLSQVFGGKGLAVDRSHENIPGHGRCEEQTKIVFISVHMAKGDVVTNILQRFGDLRNLTFVLPKEEGDENTGWPQCFQTNHMLPSRTGSYDILCNHAVYNPRIMNLVMPKAPYATILRRPETQFPALFHRYHLAQRMGILASDPLKEFLLQPGEYIHRFSSLASERALLQNPQAYDLGLDPENFEDEDAMQDLIRDMETNFHLVMIAEYMDESLVLLKRQMCWTLDDIVYFEPGFQVKSDVPDHPTTDALHAQLRKWNNVDVILYQHFSKVLWKKIHDAGPVFQEEVAEFRRKNAVVRGYCLRERDARRRRHRDGEPAEGHAPPINSQLCEKIDTPVSEYSNLLRSRPDHYLRNEL